MRRGIDTVNYCRFPPTVVGFSTVLRKLLRERARSHTFNCVCNMIDLTVNIVDLYSPVSPGRSWDWSRGMSCHSTRHICSKLLLSPLTRTSTRTRTYTHDSTTRYECFLSQYVFTTLSQQISGRIFFHERVSIHSKRVLRRERVKGQTSESWFWILHVLTHRLLFQIIFHCVFYVLDLYFYIEYYIPN